MSTSNRRLERTPSRRRQVVDTLEQLIDAFLTHHRAVGSSESTVRHYADSLLLLNRCFQDEGIESVSGSLTSHNMNVFAGWLRSTPTKVWRGKTERSVFGVHGALKDLKAFMRWCQEDGLIDSVPKVPVPRLPHVLFPVLSEPELDSIFRSTYLSGNSELAIRNRALMAFMLDTGVRLSEASSLTLANLNMKMGEAKIRGKGNKERIVYFSESVTDVLKRWLALRGDEPGVVFWLEASGIRMLFRRIKIETRLPLLTAHQVRHTAFTMMVKRGVDLHSVKRIAGHASVTTTEAYLALAGEDLREKHASGSPFEAINRRAQPVKQPKRRLRAS